MKFKAKAGFCRTVGRTDAGSQITATIKMPFEVEAPDRASAHDGVWEVCNELGLTGIEIELVEEGDGFAAFEKRAISQVDEIVDALVTRSVQRKAANALVDALCLPEEEYKELIKKLNERMENER